MGYLRDRAEKAQKELLDIVLEFITASPDKCFTNADLIENLGLIKGNGDYFPCGIFKELEQNHKIEKQEKGYRLLIQGRCNRLKQS